MACEADRMGSNPIVHPKIEENLTSYWKIRREVINAYGGKCVKCGFNDIRALQLDHVDGNGTKHRKYVSVRMLMFWLKRNAFPKTFQLLCANCNSIKRFEECGFILV